MRTLLISSLLLWVALSITAAAVVPSEAAAEHQEGRAAAEPDAAAAAAAAADDRAPGLRQARFSFCLSGWLGFRGSCYYMGNDAETWQDAERFCASFGGSLASVHDIWEYSFLQRMVQSAGHTFAWIGGYYFLEEWRWEDGSVFNYENWDTAARTDQYQCLQLNSHENTGWSNHGCGISFPFVCQVKPSC